jgi:hypothetical protein
MGILPGEIEGQVRQDDEPVQTWAQEEFLGVKRKSAEPMRIIVAKV